MTQAKLNTQLYQKMFAEQKLYRAGLLLMPPTEILNHAYEYVCRENILLSLEYNDLSSRQAHALLKSPTPLADIFAKLKSIPASENFGRPAGKETTASDGSCYAESHGQCFALQMR